MININVCCDYCKSHCQPLSFDDDIENVIDLKGSILSLNWQLSDEPGTKETKAKCPSCVRDEAV